jgi:hypothetical protein
VAAGDLLDVRDRAPHHRRDQNPTASRHVRRRRLGESSPYLPRPPRAQGYVSRGRFARKRAEVKGNEGRLGGAADDRRREWGAVGEIFARGVGAFSSGSRQHFRGLAKFYMVNFIFFNFQKICKNKKRVIPIVWYNSLIKPISKLHRES